MLLKAEGLVRSFGSRRVFGPLSFEVPPGRVLGVAGPNGSGKTTLLKTLAGLIRPSSGDVWLIGPGDRLAPRDAARHLGWAAPDLNLYAELTAVENLSFFARLHGRPADTGSSRKLLEEVGLDPAQGEEVPIRALSTGQRQRLKLAFAILNEPAVLLLDEPGSNLDEAGRGVVAAVVKSQRARGAAVVASNDPRDLALADERVNL